CFLKIAKVVCGFSIHFTGLTNIPKSGHFLIAAKHQSIIETIAIKLAVPRASFILKKQLLSIPICGYFLKRLDNIVIDRAHKTSSIRQIIKQADSLMNTGQPIVIFPQGTRVAVGEDGPNYKSSLIKLCTSFDTTLIPLALNTGVYWPPHDWHIHPGCAIIAFLQPFATNSAQDRQTANILVEQIAKQIETKSKELVAQAVAPGS
ncbi:MAG: lysophospholipid acyltransferase family protein, partial [Pseudomonadota bacterium]